MKNKGGFRPGIKKRMDTEKYTDDLIKEVDKLSDLIFKKLVYENYAIVYGDLTIIDRISKIITIERLYVGLETLEKQEFPVKLVKKDEKLEEFLADIAKESNTEVRNIKELYALIIAWDNITETTSIDDIYIDSSEPEEEVILNIKALVKKVIPSKEKLLRWGTEVDKEYEIEAKKRAMQALMLMNLLDKKNT